MFLVIVLVVLVPVSIILALLWGLFMLQKNMFNYFNLHTSIDFNEFIKYHEQRLYVDGIEEPNVAKIALAIQQRVGSEREDFNTIENILE